MNAAKSYIRHELMEMDRTSIVALTILVSPFSIIFLIICIFLIKDCLTALATSLTGGWGRRAVSNIYSDIVRRQVSEACEIVMKLEIQKTTKKDRGLYIIKEKESS